MNVLCKTCSVLMLISIAPICLRMSVLVALPFMREIFRTQRFKTKYPWRIDYKHKIRPSSFLKGTGDNFGFHFDLVTRLLDAGGINAKTGRAFVLSFVIKRLQHT
jgi:hypothetical protein